MRMKSIVKKFIALQTRFITWELNLCQKFACFQKHRGLIKRQKIKKREWLHVDEYRNYYKRFGLSVPRIDYYFFASYLTGYGKDPTLIVPEIVVQNLVNPILNPIEYREYYQDKNNFDKVLPPGILPETILRKIGGRYYTKNYTLVENLDDTKLFGYLAPFDRVIIKPSVNSSSGNGVDLFVRMNTVFKHLKNKTTISVSYLDKIGKDFIIQKCMSQSSDLSRFNPTSINTIRVCIYRSVKDDNVKILWHILRIGKNGAFVDNAHAGGAIIGINEKGELDHHLLNQYGDKFAVHNGIDFSTATYRIPQWERVMEFSKRVGERILHHRLIQLDIMLDSNNEPHLIEYNLGGPSIWMAMFTGQQVLSDYREEILEYCINGKEKVQKVQFVIS